MAKITLILSVITAVIALLGGFRWLLAEWRHWRNKRRWIAMILISILCPVYAYAEDLYIGQSSAGAGDGTSCANQRAISFFNTAGNWGVGANKISAGDTVYLCGTITTKMTVQAAGSAGNVITISPAPSQTTTFDATGQTGAMLNFAGNQYITLDGVTGDKVAGDTNYTLIFTNLASTGGDNTYAMYDNGGGSNVIIKHVKAIFTGSASSDDNGGCVFITSVSGGGYEVSHVWCTGTSEPNKHAQGITSFTGSGNGTSFTSASIIHHNWIEYIYHDGIRVDANASVYNNHLLDVKGSGHSDAIICQSGNYCQIYNNFLDNASDLYLDNILNNTRSHVRVYNNVVVNSTAFGIDIVAEGGASSGWDDVVIANNTFWNISGSPIRGSPGTALTNFVWLNNILSSPSGSYENITLDSVTSITFASATSWDYNAYGTGGSLYPDIANLAVGQIYTLAELQALSPARETNGRVGNVTFVNSGSGDLHLASGDTVAQGNGVDLTSTYSYLTTDKDGVARPSGSAWDLGAYEYVATTTNGLALFLRSVEVLIPLSGIAWHFRRGIASVLTYIRLSVQLVMALIVVPHLVLAGRTTALITVNVANRTMALLGTQKGTSWH